MDFTNLKILCYHGVTNSASDGIENFSGKHIEEKIFYRQIDFLKKNCTVLSMDEVIELSMQKKIWPQNPVAVTFDDGFKPTALYNVVRDFIFVRNSNALNGAPLVVFGNKLPEPGKFSVNVVTFKVQPDGSPHLFQMCGK